MPGSLRARFLWTLKHTLNPVTAAVARSGHGPFALVRHVGRRSGRTYETPLVLARVPCGFVAELTYGETVDWYRNVAAAGRCTVIYHGREYEVDGVSPYSAEQGLAAYPNPRRAILRATGRKEFRLLSVSPPDRP